VRSNGGQESSDMGGLSGLLARGGKGIWALCTMDDKEHASNPRQAALGPTGLFPGSLIVVQRISILLFPL